MDQKRKVLSTLSIVGVMAGFVTGTGAEAITASQTEVTTANSQIDYFNFGDDSQYRYRTHLVDDSEVWFVLTDDNNNFAPVLKKWDGENLQTISLGSITSMNPGWTKLGSKIYFSATESSDTPGSSAYRATFRLFTLDTTDNSITKGTENIASGVNSVNDVIYGGLADGNGNYDLASFDGSTWTRVCADNGSGVTWDAMFTGNQPETDGSRYFLMREVEGVNKNVWVYDTVAQACDVFTSVGGQQLDNPKHPTVLVDELYFAADATDRENIYKYTPGDVPTIEKTDISFQAGNVVSSMTSMDGELVYSAGPVGDTAIYTSDGTAAGTTEIVDLTGIANSDTTNQSRAHANSLFVLDGVVYFTFFTTDEGEEIWAYDNGQLEQLTAQTGSGDFSIKSNANDDYDDNYVPSVGTNAVWLRAEADSTVGLVRVTPKPTQNSPAPAPAPYSGPLITSVGTGSAVSALSTETIRVSGERLGSVSGVSVDGKPGEVISVASDHFMMKLPLGLEPGTYDLVVQSSIGNLTYLDAITIVGSNAAVDSEEIQSSSYGEVSAWTKRISDDQVKVYVKYPTVGEKVRIGHQTGGSGSYESIYVKTTSSETMEGLRIVEGVGTYIVRTIELEEINRIRVTVGDSVEVQVRYNN